MKKSPVKIVTDARDLPMNAIRAASFKKLHSDMLRQAAHAGKIRGWKFLLPGESGRHGLVYLMADEAHEYIRQFEERKRGKKGAKVPVAAPVTLNHNSLESIEKILLRIESLLEDVLTRPHQKLDDEGQLRLDIAG